MIEVDFAILGGGASGLSLALALAQSLLGNHSILLVEKESKNRNDRTWCYWARENSPFYGIIPMTDHPFPRQLGNRVLSIGARGGRVKPSTGFAFSRIQRDTRAIVNSLVHHHHPFDIPPDSRRHRFYDSIMLDVMLRQNDQVKQILTTMFTRNPVQRILRFLDDQTHIWEDIKVLASLPPVPFLRALRNHLWK